MLLNCYLIRVDAQEHVESIAKESFSNICALIWAVQMAIATNHVIIIREIGKQFSLAMHFCYDYIYCTTNYQPLC